MKKRTASACAAGLTLAVAFLLTGCVKDHLNNTPHPDKGAITVSIDWDDLLPEAVADNYVLNVDGNGQTVSGFTNTAERLAEPGEHSLMVYNHPDGITINGDIASVDEIISGRSAGSRIVPLPGYLFSLSRTVTVVKDDTLHITAKPQQWGRQLDLVLSATAGDYDRIVAVTGTLSGVERSVDIRKGERQGKASRVRGTFTAEGGKYRISFRLMGIVPAERQMLTVDIALARGGNHTIESDLTDKMTRFHDAITPLTITGNLRLPEAAEAAGATGSIEGWQIADGGNTDAH